MPGVRIYVLHSGLVLVVNVESTVCPAGVHDPGPYEAALQQESGHRQLLRPRYGGYQWRLARPPWNLFHRTDQELLGHALAAHSLTNCDDRKSRMPRRRHFHGDTPDQLAC